MLLWKITVSVFLPPLQLLRGTERCVETLRVEVLRDCSHWAQQVGFHRDFPALIKKSSFVDCRMCQNHSLLTAGEAISRAGYRTEIYCTSILVHPLQDKPEEVNALLRQHLGLPPKQA